MIQAMQILQLPSLELMSRVEQELIENPFLEVDEGESGEEASDAEAGQENKAELSATEGSSSEADADASGPETDGLENMLDELERYERDFGDGPMPRMVATEEGDRKYEAMQNTPSLPQSLPQALLDQVAFLTLDERQRTIIEYLIWSLDEHGYLMTTEEQLAEELSVELEPAVEFEEVENAAYALRRVTHPGIASHGLRESLLLQLAGNKVDSNLVRALISDHLKDIEANRLPRIAKATGHTIEEIKEGILAIRTLDPSPGADFGDARATVIIPDVIVEEIDGTFVVRLERQRQVDLGVNPVYRKMLAQAKRGDGVREWVRKRVESARWFIDAVQQRQSTLKRIADVVFSHQNDFLTRGVSGLKPLRMQEVADDIGVHISTISRGVSGKYAQTPRGIFPLKFFFTGGTAKATGEVTSQVSIKELIRELVEKEDKKHPLSDDQLAKLLEEKDGIGIARRTVTKYRKALEIPSSSQRRSY
ncbi:MAG: RNA polymerase sigma-54 factor [Planctomycetota bacterium]|jgi:RNA polymerase sigma-54 factor